MKATPYSWMHPALEVRETGRYGLGVFAKTTIPKETTLFVCGGPILTLEDEDHLPPECVDMPIEISEWFSIGPRTPEEIPLMPQHYVNHSCDPNAGWHGQLFMVAMRDIGAGEEICYDYAMIMHSNETSATYWTMPCRCGSPHCRGLVAEDDWTRPELQARYDGWFAWHLQRKLDAGKASLHVSRNIWVRSEPHPPGNGRRSGFHWMDARVVSRSSRSGGRGCFAVANIPAVTIVFALGGRAMPSEIEEEDYGFQIDEFFVLAPLVSEVSDSDFINHSCEPNLGFLGQLFLVTLRDVEEGEELCFDYGTCLGGPDPYKLACQCKAATCRGMITQNDWKLPKLRSRYAGNFQWYLEQMIEAETAK